MIGAASSAQKNIPVQTEPAKNAKEYQPDINKPLQFILTANEVGLLTATPEAWKEMQFSDKLSGAQIEQYKASAEAARKKLIDQLNEYMNADYAKFQADTVKAIHHIKN